MSYYLVNFSATFDGDSTEYGMIRVSGAYNPNVTKNAIEEHYRRKRPSKQVAIVITLKTKVTKEKYDAAASDSIDYMRGL